jgi:hypothetical protein
MVIGDKKEFSPQVRPSLFEEQKVPSGGAGSLLLEEIAQRDANLV